MKLFKWFKKHKDTVNTPKLEDAIKEIIERGDWATGETIIFPDAVSMVPLLFGPECLPELKKLDGVRLPKGSVITSVVCDTDKALFKIRYE